MKKIIHNGMRFVKPYFLLLLPLAFSGCGAKEDPLLAPYREGIESSAAKIREIGGRIDALDPSADDADAQLLATLDEMEGAFKELAELKAPSDFSHAEELADNASNLMTDAVTLYHDAYSQAYDGTAAEQAAREYDAAMQQLTSLGDYLMNPSSP